MACKLIGTYVFLALLGIATCVKNDETDQECIKNDEALEPEVTEEKKKHKDEKCFDRHFQNDQDGMDALCEGALVCAKKGQRGRDFGCKDYYCCSEEPSTTTNTAEPKPEDKSGKDEGQMNPEKVLDDGETLDTLFKQKEEQGETDEKAAARKEAAEKEAAETAAAEKEAAEKAAAENKAAEKAAAKKEESEKEAAEKAAAEKEAAEKTAAENKAAEKAAAKKEESEKEAAEKAGAENKAAEKAAAKKEESEKEAAEKEAAEKAAAAEKETEKNKKETWFGRNFPRMSAMFGNKKQTAA